MENKQTAALALGLFISVAALFAYVKYERSHIRMDGQMYEHSGFMVKQDGNNTLYIPVYRRIEK